MLHLLYIIAFTVIAFFAVSNLIRSLINIGTETQRTRSSWNSQRNGNNFNRSRYASSQNPPHPELLDEQGRPVNEPLLVMRSVNVDDAREKLDALYNSSPNNNQEEDKD